MEKIQDPKLPEGAHGWAFWRNGEMNGNLLCRTKTSLLVSFDMMSLRGMLACEEHMREKGWECIPTRLVAKEESRLYTATVNGEIDIDMAEFSTVTRDHDFTLWTAAFYITSFNPRFHERSDGRVFEVSTAERESLNGYHWLGLSLVSEKKPAIRKRAKFAQYRAQALPILERLQIAAVPFIALPMLSGFQRNLKGGDR